MKNSSELFDLIKSMSANEKRYFKLSGVQGGSKNYLLLFDAIDEKTDYDEAAIREKFKDEKFIQQLHVTKNQLYRLILKSLRIFHEKKSIDNVLHNLLHEASLLKERGLYAQSEKRLINAKKMAQKHEKHLILLEIQKQQIENIIDMQGKGLGDKINKVLDEADSSLRLLDTEYACFRLQYNAMILYRIGIRSWHPDYSEKVAQLLELPYFDKAPCETSTFQARYAQLHAMSSYYMLSGKASEANAKHWEALQLWEAHPLMIQSRPRIYKVYINNYLQTSHLLANYADFPKYINKLRDLPSVSPFEASKTFYLISSLELLHFMNTQQYSEAEGILPAIRKGLKRNAQHITKNQAIFLQYNIMVLLFSLEAYPKSMDWLNEILNAPKTEVRGDLYRSALIFQLVIHYELGNFRVLEYLPTSITKKLQKIKQYGSFQKTMIRSINKLLATNSKEQKHADFQLIVEQLERVKQDHSRLVGLEEMLIWAKCRLEGKTFIEVLDRE